MADSGKQLSVSGSKKSRAKRTAERRKHIVAIVGIVIGLLMILSILGFSYSDEAILDKLSFVDIFRLPFNDSVKSLAAGIENWLGLSGALTANFLINSTFGFISIIFPLLIVFWSWIILRSAESKKLLTLTNYLLIFSILFSTLFGITNAVIVELPKEWSGIVGAFLSDIAVKLLGKVGAPIVILTAFFLTIVLAIDLDIHKSIERFKSLLIGLKDLISKDKQKSKYEPLYNDVSIAKTDDEFETSINRVDEEVVEQEKVSNNEAEDNEIEEVENIEDDTEEEEIPMKVVEKETEEEIESSKNLAPPEVVEDKEEEIDYVFPSIELLDSYRQNDTIPEDELKSNADLVRAKLANFGIEIESMSVTPGPVVTLYELVPASTVKISRIVNLADDIALALAAKGIRIMAPIPGKSAVGIEIPNKNPSLVSLRSVLNSNKFREMKGNLPIALGKTISGDVFTDDLSKMPHLLIAGSTGSGKSVGINTFLASLLYRLHPSDVKFVIIDPKKIELTPYKKLKNHFLAVSPDTDEDIITTPENAVYALKGVELEMEKRYDRLAAAGVRNISDYNERLKAGKLKDTETIKHKKIPYLVVVIDELADLMLTAARDVEEPIARLAQMARAVGVHLVFATQRPSVDVITGVIKANFPARVAYQVATKIDSRTILDTNGAEQLLGSGDMIYMPAGAQKPLRIQNAFISTDEVERLTEHIAKQQGYSKPFQLPSSLERKKSGGRGISEDRDEFFEEAARLIVRHQQGSVSLLQRRLKVGYSRAARLVDELEAAGIVGPFDGSKARMVLIEDEQQLDRLLKDIL
ncbi:MAG: DNA translocase FtsK 4TM domain-containing protein [Ignavibacteriales bacterium]|nr:DNA translocase FtsK 4TM domain-containing protein [Ignavibacteriales bacterium]